MNAEKVIDKILCEIVSKTRTHPAVLRGVSVRGTIAFKEVLWGLSVLRPNLNLQCIRRAAMITLPLRICVRDGEDNAALVEDIVDSVLDGRTLSKAHDKSTASGERLLLPEEMVEGLSKRKNSYPQKLKAADQETQPTMTEDEWANECPPMEDFRLKMRNDRYRPKFRVRRKELANTIMEFMEVQDSLRSNNIDVNQMYIYYHMKANRAEEEISPNKRDYSGLVMLVQDLEEKGLLKGATEKDHEFALSGEALQVLFEFLIEKKNIRDGFRGLTDLEKPLFNERRHEVRKFTSGDVFRNISFGHTLKEIVRRKKRLSDVTRSDFRVFLKDPLHAASDIVLCVDTSASMASHHKLTYARLASMGIAEKAINDGNRVALVTFDTLGRAVVPFCDKETMKDCLIRLRARGNTNMEGGIGRAGRFFFDDRSRRQKHIFLITDGQPTALSTRNYERLSGIEGKDLSEESVVLEVRKAASSGIIVSVVHIIAQGEEASTRFVQRLAQAARGRVYPIKIPQSPRKSIP